MSMGTQQRGRRCKQWAVERLSGLRVVARPRGMKEGARAQYMESDVMPSVCMYVTAGPQRWAEVRGHMANALPNHADLFKKKLRASNREDTKPLVGGVGALPPHQGHVGGRPKNHDHGRHPRSRSEAAWKGYDVLGGAHVRMDKRGLSGE